MLRQDVETWVQEIVGGLGAYPAYYAHMGPGNAAGPGAPDLSPPSTADAAELLPTHRGRRVGRRPAQPRRSSPRGTPRGR